MDEENNDPQFRAAYLQANFDNAKRAHALHDEAWQFSSQATVQFALEALRAAALINGGAVVASLAFAGTVYQNKPAANQMLLAVEQFSYGVISVGIATAFAYIAQYLYTTSYTKVEKHSNTKIDT